MTAFINKTKAAALEYKVAILWLLLFSVNSLTTCISASLVNSNWDAMGGQDKVLFYLAVTSNWTGTVMAFLSKASQKLKDGELPTESP